MSRFEQSADARGSLHWIQVAVNDRPIVLDAAVRAVVPSLGSIAWVSPLRGDGFAEYRDEAFLERLKLDPARLKVSLRRFWPARGPQWDALGTADGNRVVLVEAKANVPELMSGGTKASPASAALIRRSLAATQRWLKAKPGCDWSQVFYQYANRLAHLYFLRKLCGVDAYLVFVYFINSPDPVGPTSRAEWAAAIEVLHEALGIRGRLPKGRVADVFIDVRELR